MKKLLLIAAANTAILSSAALFAECDVNASMDSSTTSSSMENPWYLKLNVSAVMFDKKKDKTTKIKMVNLTPALPVKSEQVTISWIT